MIEILGYIDDISLIYRISDRSDTINFIDYRLTDISSNFLQISPIFRNYTDISGYIGLFRSKVGQTNQKLGKLAFDRIRTQPNTGPTNHSFIKYSANIILIVILIILLNFKLFYIIP